MQSTYHPDTLTALDSWRRAPAPGEPRQEFSYPLLRPNAPILRRAPTVLQIGLDEGAVVVENSTRPFECLLGMLDGCHHVSQIHRAALEASLPASTVDDTLARLRAAGLVSEPRHRGAEAGTRNAVRLIGAGRIGRALAELLAGSEVSDLEIVDGERVDPAVYPRHTPTGTQAEALRAVLQQRAGAAYSGVGALTTTRVAVGALNSSLTGSEWVDATTGSPPRAPALTVVASDMLEVDRLLVDTLLRADQPHLLVRASGAGMDVGPLILPGVTACVRCTDLARRDLDPAWPTLIPQVCRVRATLPAALVGWAAGVAAAQVLAFVSGQQPETAGATIELSAGDYATRLRVWNAHPECGCSWRLGAQ